MKPIDADVLTKYINNIVPQNGNELGVLFQISNYIKRMSSLDVKPVIHGKWVIVPKSDVITYDHIKCSECGAFPLADAPSPYCSYCGASMEGYENETD